MSDLCLKYPIGILFTRYKMIICSTLNFKQMNLVKYNTNNGSVNNSFDKLIGDIFGRGLYNDSTESQFIPNVDIIESDKNYEISVSLPGVEKNDIKVDVEKNVLTISGSRNLKTEDETRKYKSIETHFGSFKRSFKLPEDVNTDDIKAEYKNGILNLEIPKNEITKKSISIKVK